MTATEFPGGMAPTEIPVPGLAEGCALPPTVTLPETSEVPAGMLSESDTLVTAEIPLLLITEV
ncbi:hypothetical protein D3C76_1749500 [compost metagenome]